MENTLDSHVVAYQGNNLYDFDNNILLNWYPQRILMHAGNANSLLELGLGHGFTAKIFSSHFKHHVVLEGSAAVIQHFKTQNLNSSAKIIQTYFENFETSEKFDVIVMGFILDHVDNSLPILTRFKRFLAPNGIIFVAVPNAEVLNRRLGHLAGLLSNILQLSENDHQLGHKRYYTVNTLTEEINAAGCTIESLEGIYLKPFTTSQIISLHLTPNVLQALCEIGIAYPELCCGLLAKIRAI